MKHQATSMYDKGGGSKNQSSEGVGGAGNNGSDLPGLQDTSGYSDLISITCEGAYLI